MRKIYYIGLIGILLSLVAISPVIAFSPVTTNVAGDSHSMTVSQVYGSHGRYIGSSAILNSVRPVSPYNRLASHTLPVPGKTSTFTESDNGKTISVTRGQVVKVQLDENPTTGYRWATSISSGIQVTGDTYAASTSGRMGAGGVHTWTLKITGTGDQHFDADYKRSWEPGSADSYSIHFVVI